MGRMAGSPGGLDGVSLTVVFSSGVWVIDSSHLLSYVAGILHVLYLTYLDLCKKMVLLV